MDLQTIKEKMKELAIGNKYMAECCGVTDHYLGQCLKGSKKMTKALEKKIMGVIKSIQITPKSSLKDEKVVIKEKKPYPSLDELAEWYKNPQKEEKKMEEEIKQLPELKCASSFMPEPNISGQLRCLCINLAQMFGDTSLSQSFTVCGNKRCFVKIEIDEVDE